MAYGKDKQQARETYNTSNYKRMTNPKFRDRMPVLYVVLDYTFPSRYSTHVIIMCRTYESIKSTLVS